MEHKRFAIRTAKMTIENNLLGILKSSPEELRECQELLRGFIKGTKEADPRSRLMAAREKLNLTKEILMYETPAVQKSEMTVNGLPEPPRELIVKIVGDGKAGKK
jgi:hypothetical protein